MTLDSTIMVIQALIIVFLVLANIKYKAAASQVMAYQRRALEKIAQNNEGMADIVRSLRLIIERQKK